ncbi:MAG: iron uptake porin [Candidatus Sericytochromatia bacterium]
MTPGRLACALLAAALIVPSIQPAAVAAPQAEDMRDLPPDHWAYRAIERLVERYGVMAGFPDNTFRGAKTVSRYELAAALNNVMQRMDQLAAGRPVTKPAVDAVDKATVEKLKAEFRGELTTLEGRVKANEDALKELQGKLGGPKFGGSIVTTVADDTLDQGKDRSAPYMATALNFKVQGKLDDTTSYDGAFGGTIKAGGSGDVPGPMGGGTGPTATTISLRSARITSKIGTTTVNIGHFPMWLAGFGPYSSVGFKGGDFNVGLGGIGPNASGLRTGGDTGASLQTSLGPVKLAGGVNSNILISQVSMDLGPVTFMGGYETDHKAITQNLLGTGARVKTTDNAAVSLDFGADGPIGFTLQANPNNLALTQYGGGVRGTLPGDIHAELVTMLFSPPDGLTTVATFGGTVAIPPRDLPFGGFKSPDLMIGLLDNYTLMAPQRLDQRSTTGPGGQALGKNAGLSVYMGLENPWIPNLSFEYNVQAALIEGIFLPTPAVPITAEVLMLRSSIGF